MRTRTIWIGVILILGVGGLVVSQALSLERWVAFARVGRAAGLGPGDPASCEPGTEVTVCPAGAGRVERPPVGRRTRPLGRGVIDALGAPERACCGRGAAARGRARWSRLPAWDHGPGPSRSRHR